jgi:hypothetical protein
MPGHKAALSCGGSVFSNSHRGTQRATQRCCVREELVPTGWRSSRGKEGASQEVGEGRTHTQIRHKNRCFRVPTHKHLHTTCFDFLPFIPECFVKLAVPGQWHSHEMQRHWHVQVDVSRQGI